MEYVLKSTKIVSHLFYEQVCTMLEQTDKIRTIQKIYCSMKLLVKRNPSKNHPSNQPSASSNVCARNETRKMKLTFNQVDRK